MRQRVGFARAIVTEPDALLMDEPFSALDVLTAENLRGELVKLWEGREAPVKSILIVTHNIEEAVLLADRVLVLSSNPGPDQGRALGRAAAAPGPARAAGSRPWSTPSTASSPGARIRLPRRFPPRPTLPRRRPTRARRRGGSPPRPR